MASAQQQAVLDDKAKARVRDEIQRAGGRCPEIRDVRFVGSEDRGNVLRVFCAEPGGPVIEGASYRLIVGSRGNARLSPWTE